MKVRAYAVHVFTALGAALGVLALVLIFNHQYHGTLWVLLAAGLIDSVDGAFARATNIKKNAPRIDGALMDNIIDFFTWTVAPLLWVYAVVHVPVWVVMICAIASIFGFTNTQAKTGDNFFTGFPSFWNLVVLYLFLLHFSVVASSVVLLLFSVATFLPVKFIYPSKTKYLQTPTLILGAIYAIELIVMIYLFDQTPNWLLYISFVFPVYYFGTSFYLQMKHKQVLFVK